MAVNGDENVEDQAELHFPDPDEFPNHDDVESEDGQAELPMDSFDESKASNEEANDEGCGCVR